MIELVDVACDICGQVQRWNAAKLGQEALCRSCGTTYDAEEYVPPAPEEEEEPVDSPWPWIKGACVAALILASLGGLGSLLVYRPAPRSRTPVAAAPSGPGIRVTPPTTRSSRRSRGFSDRTRAEWREPTPTPPATTPPPEEVVAEREPVPAAPAGPDFAGPPEATAWRKLNPKSISGLRVTGRGFRNASEAQKLFGSTLVKAELRVVSDTEVELPSVLVLKDMPTLVMITTDRGTAVLFPDDTEKIDAVRSMSRTDRGQGLRLVTAEGRVVGQCPPQLSFLVEAGGRIDTDGPLGLCIVQNEAVINADVLIHVVAEHGASVNRRFPPRRVPSLPAMRYFPLPALTP